MADASASDAHAAVAAARQAALNPQADRPRALSVVAESDVMIWNAVAVYARTIYVSGPRWTGSAGPALASLDADGNPQPFPDAAWNDWRPGSDAKNAFVCVNALHLEGELLWVVDAGSPEFGGDPVPGGAKVVCIDLTAGNVKRIYPLHSEVAKPGSYVDDIRINANRGYLTDAGNPGIIVLDLDDGSARRTLDGHPSTVAPADRAVVVDGETVHSPDGSLLHINSDPLDLSADKMWFYYGTLEGPWSRIETRFLDDASLTANDVASHVEPWADIPPIGGAALVRDGSLYFTDLAGCALRRRKPDGEIETVVADTNLHWVDAPFIEVARVPWTLPLWRRRVHQWPESIPGPTL